jgi:hypothetical protein
MSISIREKQNVFDRIEIQIEKKYYIATVFSYVSLQVF